MQRKFLEDLGIEKDTVDKIMAENGRDVTAAKKGFEAVEAERDNYRSQLETAQTALKGFEGVDVNELNGRIKQLGDDLRAKEAEYQAKIADMEFTGVLDAAVSASGARNAKAVKALLDLDTLKSSKNRTEDIRAAIEAVKKENDFLFSDGAAISTGVPAEGPAKETKMSLTEAMAYKNAHPDADISTLI